MPCSRNPAACLLPGRFDSGGQVDVMNQEGGLHGRASNPPPLDTKGYTCLYILQKTSAARVGVTGSIAQSRGCTGE